jgi:hypothetical protein
MLRLDHGLLFPSLRRFGETSFKSWQDESKTTDLYTLYWDDIDKIKQDNFLHHSITSSSKFPGTLPKEYDDITKSFVFALPQKYVDEIKRQARTAQTEWSQNYQFDTNIREICLKPAITHIQVAFALLKDCLYDPSTNYFSRSPLKNITSQMMLYKFWSFQTGRSQVTRHSLIEDLEHESKLDNVNSENGQHLFKFLDAIKKYEYDLDVIYTQKISTCCGTSNSNQQSNSFHIDLTTPSLKLSPVNITSSNEF